MSIEIGQRYKFKDGMIVDVTEYGEVTCRLKIILWANGKAPKDNRYLEGPSENLGKLFQKQKAVLV